MWQPFTEEHQQFREDGAGLREKELAPHVEEWESSECFPSWVFKRAGERRRSWARTSRRSTAAPGSTTGSRRPRAEELVRCTMAGVSMGLLVQSDMATPVISDIGTKEQIEEFLKPALAGDKIAALGVSEPAAGERRGRDPDDRAQGGR